MGLADTFNVPDSDNEWNEYSFSLQATIRDINRRILEKGGPVLPEFPLDPFISREPGVQLEQLQAAMNGINLTLGISGFDYEDVDLADKSERASWVWLLATNVRQAAGLLGVG